MKVANNRGSGGPQRGQSASSTSKPQSRSTGRITHASPAHTARYQGAQTARCGNRGGGRRRTRRSGGGGTGVAIGTSKGDRAATGASRRAATAYGVKVR